MQSSPVSNFLIAILNAQLCMLHALQNLRRRIDVLSKQKSDMRASVAAAKSTCESKASDNEDLRAQVQV